MQESRLPLHAVVMKNVFKFLLPSSLVPEPLRQGVRITNILALTLFVLTIFLFFVLFSLFGWSATSGFIIAVACIFLFTIIVNHTYYNFGRLLFCLVPVYLTLFISLYGKEAEQYHSYITYFDSRFVILVTTIFPAIVFKLYERTKIAVCLASTFVCLMFFDPIHSALGLGYFQQGFDLPSYNYINYITFTCYLVLLFGVFTLKVIMERAEQQVQESLLKLNFTNNQLISRNQDLTRLNQALEIHQEKLLQQQEEIETSHEKLTEANWLISEHQQKLITYNLELEKTVLEKSADLIATNEELVRHNNELQQFSYTISHNLRGPVARLLGLTNLMDKPISVTEKEVVGSLISKSGRELDEVLKDLSLIIDIRNDLYLVRERISFQEEWRKAVSILQDQIRPDYKIDIDFSEAPDTYSIRAMIQSILFNLLSNAIKYRNPEMDLQIKVRTHVMHGQDIVLKIADNGLGFNVEGQKENLFKLYKRFHTHVDGKGLGLYLVKTQLDTLGGKIDIESGINRGTTFTITLPVSVDVSKQVFFESEAAQIYYDANLNNTVIIWKKDIKSIEYRRAFQMVLHTLKTYHTPGWIADLRLQGRVAEEDQIWFLKTVLPEAASAGLKRVAAVGFTDPIRSTYYNRMIAKSADLNITLKVFDSLEEAIDWMAGFVHRAKVGSAF